jgi:hypothetical protein
MLQAFHRKMIPGEFHGFCFSLQPLVFPAYDHFRDAHNEKFRHFLWSFEAAPFLIINGV